MSAVVLCAYGLPPERCPDNPVGLTVITAHTGRNGGLLWNLPDRGSGPADNRPRPPPCGTDRGRRYELDPGWYAYVGRGRLSGGRHEWARRPAASSHAHVDRLRARAAADELWQAESPSADEHFWGIHLGKLPGARNAVRGFGSTNCHSDCPGHLYPFSAKPSAAAFGSRPVGEFLVDFFSTPGEAHARLGPNASPNALAYERGRRYLEERRRAAASGGADDPTGSRGSLTAFAADRAGRVLATEIASKYGLPAGEYEATFAEAAESVVATCGPKALTLLLGRLTPERVVALAAEDEDVQRREVAALAEDGQQP